MQQFSNENYRWARKRVTRHNLLIFSTDKKVWDIAKKIKFLAELFVNLLKHVQYFHRSAILSHSNIGKYCIKKQLIFSTTIDYKPSNLSR